MEPSSPSENAIEPPPHRWVSIVGTTIAILTLTVPLLVIANYSSPIDPEPLAPPSYVFSKPRT